MDWKAHLRAELTADGNSPDDDVLEELSQHAAAAYDAARSEGCSHADAIGRVEPLIAEWRRGASLLRRRSAARLPDSPPGSRWLTGIWQDVRYGCRGLLRQPAFTGVAVLTLGLGIGATAATFSAIQNVLLDPAPYADVHRLAMLIVRDATTESGSGRNAFQIPEILEFQRQNQSFEAITAGRRDDVLVRTGEGTEQFRGAVVTPNTFQFLGVPPLVGRPLVDADAAPAAPPVFVMSHRMWASRFNSDAGVVGRTFMLDEMPTTCVGVMPPRFTKNGGDLWRPLALEHVDAKTSRQYFFFQGKLKPGVTFEQATAEMEVITRRVAKAYPELYPKQFRASVVSWLDGQIREFRTTLYTLFAAVALLLLIACGNVANMLLVRGATRAKELAIRTSLGASRWLVVRQLLVESVILALGGTILGCLFAYAGIQGIAALMPRDFFPGEIEIRMNVPVLIFSLVTGVLTAMVFGLVPALQTVNSHIAVSLNDAGRGVIGGFRRGKLRNALVVSEVAISLVLLSGAGLLMRSFIKLQTVDLGLSTKNVVFVSVSLPPGQYTTAEQKQRFFADLLDRFRAMPGVLAAAATTSLPPYGGGTTEVDIPGKTHAEPWRTMGHLTSEGYVQTVGRRLLRGREFSPVDVASARKVAVINETFAKRYLPTEDPIGRQVRLKELESLPDGNAVPNAVFDIVGVISDAKNSGVVEPPVPEVFLPYTITGMFRGGFLVKAHESPEALTSAVRREIWAVDQGVAITDIATLDSYLTRYTYARPRFSVVLLGLFASIGLILVATGLYSVIAYTVSRQTREIGIRMALGAGRGVVLGMVAVMGLRLIVIGAFIGLMLSFGATRLIASQLVNISPHDPLTLGGVVALMATVGIAACYFPARRAASVDPLVALRMD